MPSEEPFLYDFEDGPFCCTKFTFDVRASSPSLSDSKKAQIHTFIESIKKDQVVYAIGEVEEYELPLINTVFKVNIIRGLLRRDFSSWFYAPAEGDEEGVAYYGVFYLEKAQAQPFDMTGEGSYLSFWCKEHRLRFRVGVFERRVLRGKEGEEVRKGGFGDERVDMLLGVEKPLDDYLRYPKKYWAESKGFGGLWS
jgi:hypothetical protein